MYGATFFLACPLHRLAGGEKSSGSVGGAGDRVFFAGADGGEAVDVQEGEGGGAGDCGDGVCAGDETGAGEGVADERGGGVFEVEGWCRAGCDSGPADGGFQVFAGFFGRGGGDDQ